MITRQRVRSSAGESCVEEMTLQLITIQAIVPTLVIYMILRKVSHRAYYSRQFVIVHPFRVRFDGQIVDITGGASGIGAAIAKRVIAENAKLIVANMCDDKKSQALVVQFDGEAYFHKRGTFDPLEASSIVTDKIMQFSDLDIVHNNAAAFACGEIPVIEPEQWS